MPPTASPASKGAHEKGGFEGQIGWYRRNHLVPVPEVDSLAEPNIMVDGWDEADDARRIGSRARTVGEHRIREWVAQVLCPPGLCGPDRQQATTAGVRGSMALAQGA